MALLDTHKTVKEFIAAGIKEEHAEVITTALSRIDNQVASKGDVSELKHDIAEFKSEIREDFASVKKEVADVKKEVHAIKNDMVWTKGLLFLILALILKQMLF